MDTLFLGVFFVLGAIIASFIGMLSERLYTGQAWAKSRSRCNSCRRTLGIPDLIPIVSWLVFFGRCRSCGAAVPATYLFLELVLAALFALSYTVLGLSLPLGIFLAALSVLTFIVVYDLRHTLVPTEASITLGILALLFAFTVAPTLYAFGNALIWAGGIGLGFLLLHVFSKGRAMGLGDAPLAFSLALLAAPNALAGLLFSFWIGALCALLILGIRGTKPTMGIEVPFVPYMAAGFLLAYFTGWNPLPF